MDYPERHIIAKAKQVLHAADMAMLQVSLMKLEWRCRAIAEECKLMQEGISKGI